MFAKFLRKKNFDICKMSHLYAMVLAEMGCTMEWKEKGGLDNPKNEAICVYKLQICTCLLLEGNALIETSYKTSKRNSNSIYYS